MNAKENVLKLKARLDEAVYNALYHLNDPGIEEYLRTAGGPILEISYEYRKALLAAIPEVSTEVAEHYAMLAEQAVPKAEFLLSALGDYRGRGNLR